MNTEAYGNELRAQYDAFIESSYCVEYTTTKDRVGNSKNFRLYSQAVKYAKKLASLPHIVSVTATNPDNQIIYQSKSA